MTFSLSILLKYSSGTKQDDRNIAAFYRKSHLYVGRCDHDKSLV